LKRKVELQDFRLTQERAVASDARASLDSERGHVAEMTARLSRERSTNNDLQSALDAARDQITRLQVALEKAQAEGETLRSSLEGERSNSRNLNNSLSRDEGEINRLKGEIEREKARREAEVAKEKRGHESVKRSLDDALESMHGLQMTLELEKSAHNEARRELGATKADLRAADSKLTDKLVDLEKNLDLERIRNGELMAALERESEEAKSLTQTLDKERQQTKEEIASLRDMISGLQASLEREKRQVADLSSAVEREKITVASMAASMERTKAAAREEAEAERQAAERTRESLEAAQQETVRLEEVLTSERQEFSALKSTTTLLESEVVSLEDEMQRKKDEREVERQMEKKKQKELEREKQLEKDARNELEVDVTTLKRKISDLETILSENRDRELAALAGRGVATSMRMTSSDRHVVGPSGDGVRPEESELDLSGFEDLMRNNDKLRKEKDELRSALSKLEEEVWQFRRKEIQPSERTDFERALRDAKTELATLRCNVESTERERRRQQQQSYATDKEKLQKLYNKYLRAESFRKALVYQKRYLLLLLGGFQDCEQATLSMIAKMGAYPSPDVPQSGTKRSPAFTKFRSAVRTVIAIQRLKFLVKKWQRASTSGSRALRSHAENPSSRCSSAASSVRASVRGESESLRQPLPLTPTRRSSGVHPAPSGTPLNAATPPRSHAGSLSLPTGLTPPTKENGAVASGSGAGLVEDDDDVQLPISSSSRKTFLSPKLHSSSTSLRREEPIDLLNPSPSAPSLISASNVPVHSPRSAVHSSAVTPRAPSVADSSPSDSDDYIQRLENLQQRLGRMSPACSGPHAHHFAASSSSTKLY